MKGRLFKVVLVILFFISPEVFAQKFSADKGQISFFSDASLEDIDAKNTLVGSLFDAGTGDLVFIAKIKDFIFVKSLMREHFNEKYMETDKFPKATFQGKLVGFKTGISGEQKVHAIGKLNIHGITRQIDIPGTVEFLNGKPALKSKFMIKLDDYNIKVPKMFWQKIAEEVEVTVDFTYKQI